jgi:parvulin-like peptidyl-prolyl isomerase
MNRKIPLSIFLLALGASLFSEAIDKQVASVRLTKPQSVTVRQLRAILDPMEQKLRRPATKDERRQVLESQINRILIEQAAERDKVYVSEAELKAQLDDVKKKAGIQLNGGKPITDEELKTYVERQGISFDNYVKEQKYAMLTLSYARFKEKSTLQSIQSPTTEEARDYYDENKKEFFWDDSVMIRWILIDTTRFTTKDQRDKAAERARDALKELRSGAKFADVARKYSDDTLTRNEGGEIPRWFMRNDLKWRQSLGMEFSKKILSMKKGEISDVLTASPGYAIVQVTDRIDARILGFNDKIPVQPDKTVVALLKERLEDQRRNDAYTKALKEITENLRKEAEIKIFDNNLDW